MRFGFLMLLTAFTLGFKSKRKAVSTSASSSTTSIEAFFSFLRQYYDFKLNRNNYIFKFLNGAYYSISGNIVLIRDYTR